MRKDLKFGLIFGGLSVLWMLLMWAIGLHGEEIKSYSFINAFYYIIPIVCISMGIKAIRRENGGYIKYGKAFGVGTIIGLVGSTVYGLFYYIYINMINPEVIANKIKRTYTYYLEHPEIIEKSGKSMEELMQISSAQISSNVANISIPVMIFILCLITTLIIAAIYKKEPQKSVPTQEEIDAFLNEDNEDNEEVK